MKRSAVQSIALIALVLVILALAASLASAGGSVDALIKDASDGVVDGTYSIAVVRQAINIVRTDPVYSEYSDIDSVLTDYLATLTAGHPTSTPTSTPKVSPTSTTSSTVAPTASPSPHHKKKHHKASQTASPRPTAGATPTATPAPDPTPTPASGWHRVSARLAAMPWFFGVVIAALVAGLLLLRLRRRA